MKNDKEYGDDKDDGDNRATSSLDIAEPIADGERPKVIGIQDWKNRASARSARLALYEQKIQLLSTPQKQALLIRLIVCEDITTKDLDALLGVLAADAVGP